MPNDRRQSAVYSKSFYMTVTVVFALISAMTILAMIFQGVTEARLFVALVSLWYLVYSMDLVERRFQRDTDNVIWKKLFQLRGSSSASEAKSEDDCLHSL